MSDLSQADLKRLFEYNPATGVFLRLVTTSSNALAGREAGSFDKDGYRRIYIQGAEYKAHRLAWLYVYGRWPIGEIDHINGDRSDNRIENLREVSHAENNRNTKRRSANTSGTMGVHWNKALSKWVAQINADSVKKHLGYFDDKQDAIDARKAAEKELGYHENHGRG